MTTAHQGQHRLPPEGDIPAHLQPTKWRITYLCEVCDHEWSRVTSKLGGKDPACPTKACKTRRALEAKIQEEYNIERIIESRQAPGIIGDKPIVQAIDKTAEIVMEDHNLTDLKDGIRHGESMAPKLPGKQQAQADNYFGAKLPGVSKAQTTRMGRLAMAGAFRDMALNPTSVVPGKRGESPLRHVGTERIG